MAELVAVDGYGSVTVRKLTARAGVSSATFYAHFDGKEECLVATCSLLFERLRQRVRTSRNRWHDRRTQLTRTLECLLSDLGDRTESRLAHVDSFGGGPASIGMIRDLETALELEVRTTLNRRDALITSMAASWITAAGLHLARMRALLTEDRDPDALAEQLLNWGLSCLAETADDLGRFRGQSLVDGVVDRGSRAAVNDERSLAMVAVAKLASREGYWNLTVPKIRRTAGISRASFDRHFGGVEACFLAAAEGLSHRFLAPLTEPRPDQASPEWARGAAAAICQSVSAEPALAKIAFVDLLAPGVSGMRLREELIARDSAALCQSLPVELRPSRICAEATIAALRCAIARKLEAGEASRLTLDAPTFALLLHATIDGAAGVGRLLNGPFGSASPRGGGS